MKELSDDEMIEDIEVTVFAINPLWVENDAADLKEDDLPDDLSGTLNSDIDNDIDNDRFHLWIDCSKWISNRKMVLNG